MKLLTTAAAAVLGWPGRVFTTEAAMLEGTVKLLTARLVVLEGPGRLLITKTALVEGTGIDAVNREGGL